MSISTGRYHKPRELPQINNLENMLRQNSIGFPKHLINENKVLRLTELIRRGNSQRKSPSKGF